MLHYKFLSGFRIRSIALMSLAPIYFNSSVCTAGVRVGLSFFFLTDILEFIILDYKVVAQKTLEA